MAKQRRGPAHVAALFGRTGDWLRRLEREGLIPQARRDFAGYRVYSDEDVEAIRAAVEARGARNRNA